MENISEYIEKAEKKAGTQKELAKMLGITTSYIRNVKAKKSGLPVETCIELADFIKADRLQVIAASGLVTEKDEKKRKILESCFKKTSQAACISMVIAVSVIMTPIPAKADTQIPQSNNNLYYVNRRRTERRKQGRRLSDKIDSLIYKIEIFFLRGHYA